MSNLTITDNFIGPADLVADMEEYAVKMNSLQYDKYNDVYNILPPELGAQAATPFGKLYLMSPTELDALRVYLDKAIKAGIIQKLISPAASPVMFVPKADGSLRLVVDYGRLNDIMIKNRYPLPLISDMLNRLQGAKIFTKLDCKDAYNHVRIKGGDEWKIAFCTRFGLFEYLAIPFGLTNAPATFQAFIDKALGEFLDIIVVVYLDDILIFSKDETKHEEYVRQVLAALQCHGLHLKISKCAFNVTEVDFLGFKINTEGIYMDLERIRAIEEWQPPANVYELQVFLGFANFFRRFIRNYSRIAAPLLNLLKTGKDKKKMGIEVRQTNVVPKNVVPENIVPENVVPAPFPLSKAAMEAFKALKEAFTSAPLLRYFDENKPMRVETEASAFAIGRILTQQFEVDGHLYWLPVAYYSKKLLDTETQYVWFMTTPNLLRRQLKWAEKLAEYDFNVTYCEGNKNPANGLSRRPNYELPKAATTSTAAEIVQQSFRLGSEEYKPVQEKLYALATMMLQPRRPAQQVRQGVREENVVPGTTMDVNTDMEGNANYGDVPEAPGVLRRQPARRANRDGSNGTNTHDNMEDSGMTGTPAVHNLHALEASRDGSHDDMEAGGATKAPSVRRLSAQEASRDKFRPGLADPEHHSIKGSAADADAMDIDDVVNNAPISLQIEDRASADTVEAFQLVSTCTPIEGEITAYTKMSIKQLKRAIRTEQSYNNAVRRIRQGLATPLEDRNNLAGPEMANMVSNKTNMATIMVTDASLEVATASSPIPTKMADIWKR
ncbi:gag polymerase env [Lasallia pustulata]|uniref:Gag polymerase env n=1 Tax=Lasallia pustulata TaxID=136370 RepID=A0A1W5CSF9_9LECA|nr:gag polymerase env [Lasallia pustulata]